MRKSVTALLSLLIQGWATVAGQEPSGYIVKDPRVIKIELRPNRAEFLDKCDRNTSGPYPTGSVFSFRIDVLNMSQQVVRIPVFNVWYQDRPELFRDGDKLEYKERLRSVVKSYEHHPPGSMLQGINLTPGVLTPTVYLQLRDWYEPLEPGHYQLSIKHRFEIGQDWIESEVLTFEVIPGSCVFGSSVDSRQF